ncbi:N-acetyl-alpha-D-glucosaminyl L-malate synthase [subsurface metagenome]|nr:glycosyltransferase [Clostridia bacterium]
MRKYEVATIITKLELGGAQEIVIYTTENLNRDRYNPILISGCGGILDGEVKSNPRIKSFFIPQLIRVLNPIKDAITLMKIWRLLKSEKIDLVHTHSSKAGILGRWAAHFAGVPQIFHTYHGFGFNEYQKWWIRKAFIWVERVTAWITDKLIVVSSENVKKGLANRIGKKRQYEVIHCATNIKAFSEIKVDFDQKKREFGINSGSPVVVMIACFKPQKAPQDFIFLAHRVCQVLPSTRFLLVGDGELRPEVEELIRRFNLKEKVILTGWRRDVPEIMQIIDVLVLTSLWEGLPIVFAEAMASGKPVVATAVDGAKEAIIEGVNGFLVEPHNIEKFAERVIKLLRDRNLAQRMGREGKKMVYPTFDITHMLNRIEALYEKSLVDF